MKVKVGELGKDHLAVKASWMMINAHRNNETLIPALEEVHAEFPELSPDQIIMLWLGVNAKNRDLAPSTPSAPMAWINIEDEYPPTVEGNKVLGFGAGYVFECEFEDGDWCNIGGENMTHWMAYPPLPISKALNDK